ncbi:hypothetical protein PQX77_006357 [Marasmius sp. AFHP31]|nr:hypothetical protein PQX77_006357 [Marasmius sp. AFHP31]
MKRFTHAHTYDAAQNPSFRPESDPRDFSTQSRRQTQEEQDEADETARRKAMKELVSSWNDRLQLISLITTFMASVEAGLLQVTAPDANEPSSVLDASNACLFSALILHLHASFISFVAAFFLVRYKVKEAKRAEDKIGGITEGGTETVSKGEAILDMAANHITQSPEHGSPTMGPNAKDRPNVWSAKPELVQVGPFFRQPPLNLLSRCHFLCIVCSVLGFLLAVTGIVCLAWASHPLAVRATAATSLGLCLLSSVGIVYTKYDTPHFIYE